MRLHEAFHSLVVVVVAASIFGPNFYKPHSVRAKAKQRTCTLYWDCTPKRLLLLLLPCASSGCFGLLTFLPLTHSPSFVRLFPPSSFRAFVWLLSECGLQRNRNWNRTDTPHTETENRNSVVTVLQQMRGRNSNLFRYSRYRLFVSVLSVRNSKVSKEIPPNKQNWKVFPAEEEKTNLGEVARAKKVQRLILAEYLLLHSLRIGPKAFIIQCLSLSFWAFLANLSRYKPSHGKCVCVRERPLASGSSPLSLTLFISLTLSFSCLCWYLETSDAYLIKNLQS